MVDSMTLSVKLLSAWKQVLELCKVQPGENLVFLLADYSNSEHVSAGRAAAAMLGARVTSIELGETGTAMARIAGETTGQHGATNLTGNRAAVAAMKSADMVVDMMGIDRGSEQREILDAGTRILLVKEPPEIFIRLVPTLDDKRRTMAAADRLRKAQTLHVQSAAGTDLRCRFGEYQLLVQYGIADEPGRWDHAPSTFVAAWPNERSANGTVVLDRGTTILPFKEYVRTPIKLTIKDGYITVIEGDFDADYLRDYMAKFDDPEGYAVSHLGWGMQKKAHWTTLGMYDKRQSNAMEARSFYGNFMFSTGPNSEGGGTRHTACHLDIPMLHCTVLLDGERVLENGQLVPAELRA
jgi:2,5-dihydroxypyridine 5,6-dioxygenase